MEYPRLAIRHSSPALLRQSLQSFRRPAGRPRTHSFAELRLRFSFLFSIAIEWCVHDCVRVSFSLSLSALCRTRKRRKVSCLLLRACVRDSMCCRRETEKEQLWFIGTLGICEMVGGRGEGPSGDWVFLMLQGSWKRRRWRRSRRNENDFAC